MKKDLLFCSGNRVASGNVFHHDALLYDEEYFRNMLVLERKRTERSNKAFMLMLIDISGLLQCINASDIIEKLLDIIYHTTRDTDIKGWYVADRTLGIVFIDLDSKIMSVVLNKVKTSIHEILIPAHRSLVHVSYCIFPDDQNHGKNKVVNLNAVLYDSAIRNRIAESVSTICKRCIDIAGSLAGILLFSPFFIIIPLVIKLTSRGSIFFKQTRVGQFGRQFTLIKFRTMKESNDNDIHKKFIRQFIKNSNNSAARGPAVEFKIKDDPRITWIGRFLRKSSLDEIPQFFNVLCGTMSLVGPRPAIPYEIDEYDIWHRRRVFEVKPGITGMWQIKGRSRTDFNNMVRMDIQYIKKWSPIMDIRLILKTPLALLSAKGAY